jgi:hypothetical protein
MMALNRSLRMNFAAHMKKQNSIVPFMLYKSLLGKNTASCVCYTFIIPLPLLLGLQIAIIWDRDKRNEYNR